MTITHTGDTDAPNEILAAAKEAKAFADKASRKSWPLARIGLAAGIGSAAIAGAVLFANRDKKRK